ncbi:MAG TPA: hypothetical protein VEY30_13145 [Myxococcaceae bacterium]|nr:hypothetical protein [Myxococcaceae bacterium]
MFSIRHDKGGSVWVRTGTAFANKDGSFNIVLDAVPLNGRLHVRDVMERKEQPAANDGTEAPTEGGLAQAAGAAP